MIWRQKSGSTLAQVMACCPTAPSHYLNRWWQVISKVLWHSFEGNFTSDVSITRNSWKFSYLKYNSNPPGVNELKPCNHGVIRDILPQLFIFSCGQKMRCMMTSSNGNIFRVTGHLCGEFTGPRWIPRTKASDTQSFDVFFDLRLNKRLSKQS